MDTKLVQSIKCFSTGDKPRSNNLVPHNQSFMKGGAGVRDRRGGGVVLDCRYVIKIANGKRSRLLREVEDFFNSYEGPESFHWTMSDKLRFLFDVEFLFCC